MVSSGTDNVIAALGQSNRICEVDLKLAGWQLEQVLAAMQVPFPELTNLKLRSDGKTPVIPDSFLDGSAPRLQIFRLDGIPFPGFPKLVFSANLAFLFLYNIPHSGYISPEAIVALLSVLPGLRSLTLGFQSPQSRPDRESRSLPPLKRSILSALRTFHFKGVTEYLEQLMTHIDAPRLGELDIAFFNQIDFDIPQLARFINSTLNRKIWDVYVQFDDDQVCARLVLTDRTFEIAISCKDPDWQLSSIEQIFNSSVYLLSTADGLYIEDGHLEQVWKDGVIENDQWLRLLLPFTAVTNLYLSCEIFPGIATALQELVGDRITEVLPSLQFIEVEDDELYDRFLEKIEQFIDARERASGHPIDTVIWNRHGYTAQ